MTSEGRREGGGRIGGGKERMKIRELGDEDETKDKERERER